MRGRFPIQCPSSDCTRHLRRLRVKGRHGLLHDPDNFLECLLLERLGDLRGEPFNQLGVYHCHRGTSLELLKYSLPGDLDLDRSRLLHAGGTHFREILVELRYSSSRPVKALPYGR